MINREQDDADDDNNGTTAVVEIDIFNNRVD